jgi:hypothetical protein
MLTALQERLAALISQLPQADAFAIAGGAALILQGYPDRVTMDLDYFATSAEAVDEFLPLLERSLAAAGLTVELGQTAPGFGRLRISDGTEWCQIDLGYDFRLRRPEPSPFGPVLSPEELAADKTLAVHGRALARDYTDLHALMKRFGRESLLDWASQKDPGFSRVVFAERLEQMDRLPREDFSVSDGDFVAIRRELTEWAQQLRLEATRLRDRGAEPPGISF